MNILKEGHEQAAISLTPLQTDMTVDDFLESESEIYEYVAGKLIPIPPTPVEHGNISMNLSLSLGQHVREINWDVSMCPIQVSRSVTVC